MEEITDSVRENQGKPDGESGVWAVLKMNMSIPDTRDQFKGKAMERDINICNVHDN